MIKFYYTYDDEPRWRVGYLTITLDEIKGNKDLSQYTDLAIEAIRRVREHLKDYPEQMI